jgi:hypothetical protein
LTQTVRILYVSLLSKRNKWFVISQNPLVLEGYWNAPEGNYKYVVTFKNHLELPEYTTRIGPTKWEVKYQ